MGFRMFAGKNAQGEMRAAMLVALMAVPLLSGCARVRDHRGYIVDETLVSAIQPGVDNKQSVEGALGRPTFVSQFGKEEWYYISRETRRLAFANPTAVDQKMLIVKFDANGNVAELDRRGLEFASKISPTGDKTPTLGRERGFFEDLFGNIGAVGAPVGGQGGPQP